MDDPRRRREEHLPLLEEMAHRGDPVHSREQRLLPRRVRLGHLSHRGQHISGPDCHRARISAARMAGQRPQLLRIQHGLDPHPRFLRLHLCPLPSREGDLPRARTATSPSRSITIPRTPTTSTTCWPARAPDSTTISAIYSPYQFTQYRIFEFPRYRTFAQSFPNTIPYSEGIGFIGRVLKPTDIDFTYFVTAHELGHQWWAHQLDRGRRGRFQHDVGEPGRVLRPAGDGAQVWT